MKKFYIDWTDQPNDDSIIYTAIVYGETKEDVCKWFLNNYPKGCGILDCQVATE